LFKARASSQGRAAAHGRAADSWPAHSCPRSPAPMASPEPGKGGTFYVPFPVLALASNGGDIFCAAGGGGSTANKEVPNVVHAHQYVEATGKLSTVAALNTGKSLVHNLTYSPTADLWLASSRSGCKVLCLDLSQNTLTEMIQFVSEENGKEPEQNFAKFSPDARFIVTGGSDGQVKLWQASKPIAPVLHRLCGSKTREILDADFSADGKFLAACDETGDCRLWEVSKEDPVDGTLIQYACKSVKGKALIKLVRFTPTPDGRWLLVVCANGGRGPAMVGLVAADGTKVAEVCVDKQPLKSLTLDTSRGLAVVGLMSGAKAVYTIPGLKCVKKTKELHSLPSQAVVLVGEGTAVSGSGDRDLHMLKFGGGGGGSWCCFLVLLVALLVVGFMVLRIGVKGAALGQGRTDL